MLDISPEALGQCYKFIRSKSWAEETREMISLFAYVSNESKLLAEQKKERALWMKKIGKAIYEDP